jgi:predicted membrane protein
MEILDLGILKYVFFHFFRYLLTKKGKKKRKKKKKKKKKKRKVKSIDITSQRLFFLYPRLPVFKNISENLAFSENYTDI